MADFVKLFEDHYGPFEYLTEVGCWETDLPASMNLPDGCMLCVRMHETTAPCGAVLQ
jgi:hypothetical protein